MLIPAPRGHQVNPFYSGFQRQIYHKLITVNMCGISQVKEQLANATTNNDTPP